MMHVNTHPGQLHSPVVQALRDHCLGSRDTTLSEILWGTVEDYAVFLSPPSTNMSVGILCDGSQHDCFMSKYDSQWDPLLDSHVKTKDGCVMPAKRMLEIWANDDACTPTATDHSRLSALDLALTVHVAKFDHAVLHDVVAISANVIFGNENSLFKFWAPRPEVAQTTRAQFH